MKKTRKNKNILGFGVIAMMLSVGFITLLASLILVLFLKNSIKENLNMVLNAQAHSGFKYVIGIPKNKDFLELFIIQKYSEINLGVIETNIVKNIYYGEDESIGGKIKVTIPNRLKNDVNFKSRHYHFMKNIAIYFEDTKGEIYHLEQILKKIEKIYITEVLEQNIEFSPEKNKFLD